MGKRPIEAKRAGTCAECGEPFEAGTLIRWYRNGDCYPIECKCKPTECARCGGELNQRPIVYYEGEGPVCPKCQEAKCVA